jgi:hypothetical protein
MPLAGLENKVRYLDFDDDVESTTAALALHEKSKAAGVPVLQDGLANTWSLVTDKPADINRIHLLNALGSIDMGKW